MTDNGPIFYEKLSSREYTPIERFRRASLKVFAGALGPPLSFVWSSLPKHLVFMNKDGNFVCQIRDIKSRRKRLRFTLIAKEYNKVLTHVSCDNFSCKTGQWDK